MTRLDAGYEDGYVGDVGEAIRGVLFLENGKGEAAFVLRTVESSLPPRSLVCSSLELATQAGVPALVFPYGGTDGRGLGVGWENRDVVYVGGIRLRRRAGF